MKHKVTFASFSHQGKRSNNEDNFLARRFGNIYICAVADGMGGAVAGERASKIAIEVLSEFVSENYNRLKKSHLDEVYSKIQKQIKEQVSVQPELNGMGTTLTCLVFKNGHYFWGNLGDSRIYRIRKGKIKQISVDHSYVEEYKQNHDGKIDEAIVKNYGNYLTRSLDGGTDRPDLYPREFDYKIAQPGDIFLLCSDGLILEKTNEAKLFAQIILSSNNLIGANKKLVSHAIKNGSTDNVTVVLLEYGKHKRELMSKPYSLSSIFKSNPKSFIAASFALLILFAGVLLFTQRFKSDQKQSNKGQNSQLSQSSESTKDNLIKNKNGWNIVPPKVLPEDIGPFNVPTPFDKYPNLNNLKEFRVRVTSGSEDRTYNFTENRIGRTSFRLSELQEFKPKSNTEYKIQLIAVLKDGSTIESNSATFKP